MAVATMCISEEDSSTAETQPQLQPALLRLSAQREQENFNQAVFALAFFSQRQDRELLGAISRGLLDLHFS